MRTEEGPIQAPPTEPVQAVPGTPTPPSEVFLTAVHKSAPTQPKCLLCTVLAPLLPFLLPVVKALQPNCAASLQCQSSSLSWCCTRASSAHPTQTTPLHHLLPASVLSQLSSCFAFIDQVLFPKEQDLQKSSNGSIHHCSGCYLPVKGMAATQNIGRMNRNIAA